MENVQVSIRVKVNKEIKEEAQKVFEQQGLDISEVIKMLLTKTANEGQIPFEINSIYKNSHREHDEEIARLVGEKIPETKVVDLDNPDDVKEFFDD